MYNIALKEGEIKIEPGTYNYSFEFMLPFNMPSTIEGKYGHIRYKIRVILNIPLWKNKVYTAPFTLMKALNLNDYPSLRVIYFINSFIELKIIN